MLQRRPNEKISQAQGLTLFLKKGRDLFVPISLAEVKEHKDSVGIVYYILLQMTPVDVLRMSRIFQFVWHKKGTFNHYHFIFQN